MIQMDMYLYQRAVLKIQGDIMCRVLNNLKGKTPEELLLESGQYYQVPVDVEAVLSLCEIKHVDSTFEQLEVRPEYADKGEILGLVLLDGDDVGVFYKATDSEHRQRFTMAHELGHCCLHGDSLRNGYVEYRTNFTIGEQKEIEASTFAGALLIPEHSLRNVINRLLKPSLNGLARIFNVSIPVMRKRLEILKISYYDDALDKMIEMEQ